MPFWLQIIFPIFLSVISGIITYLVSAQKSKSDIRALEVQFKLDFEKQKLEHTHQIEKLQLEHKLKMKEQGEKRNADLGEHLITPIINQFLNSDGVKTYLDSHMKTALDELNKKNNK